ncbi:MAG: aldo/keto reductase [Micropruina sp.]|uniref:aldo/keto reductase n=1 Tax=Micropruina sp. TaxID=2737536 RepID=UPI0039E4D849
MKQVSLGSAGPTVPPIAIGTMYFGTLVPPNTAHDILDAALDRDATFLDTANTYAFWVDGGSGDESESVLGSWFRARPGARDRIALATKIGARPRPGSRSLDSTLGLSSPMVRAQVEESLRRLATDHLDVLYAHIDDTKVPLDETIGALQDEVVRGTVRAIGCSNITAARLDAALRAAAEGPGYVVVQQRFTYLTTAPGADLSPHMLLDDDVIERATKHGLGLVGYSPLLSGAYTRAERALPDAYRHRATSVQLAALADASDATGLDAGQVVLSWMAGRAHPVIPVVGVSSRAQLLSAVESVSSRLPDDVMLELESARQVAP